MEQIKCQFIEDEIRGVLITNGEPKKSTTTFQKTPSLDNVPNQKQKDRARQSILAGGKKIKENKRK